MTARIAKLSLWLLAVAIILQFAMPFVYPILGDDAWIHLNWIEQFTKLFHAEIFYPRWLPEGFWGFGSPAFYFYPPLTYWLASILSYLPITPVGIFHTIGFIGTFASSLTCYWYLRKIDIQNRSAIIGALIYGVFPYRIVDLYLRNALGEHLAFIFLPVILLGIEIALRNDGRGKQNIFLAITISASGWAGILLTNIPAAVVGIYSTLLYTVIRARQIGRYKNVIFPAMGAIIGAMIAAVYLLPAWAYTNSIKLTHLWDIQRPNWDIGYVLSGVFQGVHRYLSAGLTVTFLLGIWLFYLLYTEQKNGRHDPIQSVFLLWLSFVIIVQLPLLFVNIFRILPLFDYIQFSFRWDILIVFAAAFFTTRFSGKSNEKKVSQFIIASCILTIFIGIGFYIATSNEHWKYAPTTEHMDAPEYLPSAASNNFVLAKDQLKAHGHDNTVLSLDTTIRIHILKQSPNLIYFTVDSSSQELDTVIFHRMFFPAWKFSSPNAVRGGFFSDSLGRINAIIRTKNKGDRSGNQLHLEKTEMEIQGAKISGIGLLLFLILILLTIFWRNPKAS